MTVTVEEIQELISLYIERKNAQGGTTYPLTHVTLTGDVFCIQPEDAAFVPVLREKFHPPSGRASEEKGKLYIRANPSALKQTLIEAIDRVAFYPDTEHLNAILRKLGAIYEGVQPCILPYPMQARAMNQFEDDGLRGFYTYAADFLDPGVPEKGIIICLPYSTYDERLKHNANVAMMALAGMGFKLPFRSYVIKGIARDMEGPGKPRFPESVIPADGVVGRNTLAGYDAEYYRRELRVAVMEEPSTVSVSLARWVSEGHPQPRVIEAQRLMK